MSRHRLNRLLQKGAKEVLTTNWPHRHERGQTAVIAGLSMIALVALVGLVIDAGHAWGQQRRTQNGADAVAKAGAIVIQHHLAEQGTPNDGTVGCAVEDMADVNDVVLVDAQYTDHDGAVLGPVGACASTAAIPSGAQGVKATTEQEFDTFVAGMFGMNLWTAAADATAVVAAQQAICPASAGCGVLPVTFPQTFDVCDQTNATYPLGALDTDGNWQAYEMLPPDAELNAENLAILPLCPNNPGSVGWLDYGCGNLATHIETPCNGTIPIPSWEQTHTGNINCCEAELNDLTGDIDGVAENADEDGNGGDKTVMIPIHDNTCSMQPADNDPTCEPLDDEWSGEGNNNFYHVLFWIAFKFDQAHVSGSDAECEQEPGAPIMINPGGGVGCLKGWIQNRFDAPGEVQTGPINPGDPVTTLVVLIE
jgi:hypothetical protein